MHKVRLTGILTGGILSASMPVESDLPIELPPNVTQELVKTLWKALPLGKKTDIYQRLPITQVVHLTELLHRDILPIEEQSGGHLSSDVRMEKIAREMVQGALSRNYLTQPTPEEIAEFKRFETIAELLEERAKRRAALSEAESESRRVVKTLWSTLTLEQKEAIIGGISIGALYWLMHRETVEDRHEQQVLDEALREVIEQPRPGFGEGPITEEMRQYVNRTFIEMLDKEAQKPELW